MQFFLNRKETGYTQTELKKNSAGKTDLREFRFPMHSGDLLADLFLHCPSRYDPNVILFHLSLMDFSENKLCYGLTNRRTAG